MQDIGEKWMRKSVQAYLEGEQDLKWVLGVLKGQAKEDILALLQTLGGRQDRRDELVAALNAQ